MKRAKKSIKKPVKKTITRFTNKEIIMECVRRKILSTEEAELKLASEAELFNELVRRGEMTPEEAQIALMTGKLPDKDDEDNEGEEWKKDI